MYTLGTPISKECLKGPVHNLSNRRVIEVRLPADRVDPALLDMEGDTLGLPIARTLGNTLSVENVARLLDLLGDARTKELLFTGRLVAADEARAVGVYNEVVPAEGLEARGRELAEQIAANAPLTLRSIKEAVRRVRAHGRLERADDLLLMCYLSADFQEGVRAFLAKRPPRWEGR